MCTLMLQTKGGKKNRNVSERENNSLLKNCVSTVNHHIAGVSTPSSLLERPINNNHR